MTNQMNAVVNDLMNQSSNTWVGVEKAPIKLKRKGLRSNSFCFAAVLAIAYLQFRSMTVSLNHDRTQIEIESLQQIVTDLRQTVETQKNEILKLKETNSNAIGVDYGNTSEIRNDLRQDSISSGLDAIGKLHRGESESGQDVVSDKDSSIDGDPPESDLSSTQANSDSKLAIFYNIFMPPDVDETRRTYVRENIFQRQIDFLGASHAVQSEENRTVKFFYNTIGDPVEHAFLEEKCAPYHNLQPVHMKYYEKGFEETTLGALHQYCKKNPDNNVIYVHSKGSYHPKKQQEWWMKEVTLKASSEECTDEIMNGSRCNVCGARFSGMPPHFSGNMWRAKCSYIKLLRDPGSIESFFKEAYETARAPPLNATFTIANIQKEYLGLDRYATEQWHGSHPYFQTCANKNPSRWATRKEAWKKMREKTKKNLAQRHRDYFLLPGLLWKFSTIYGDTIIPPEDSWVWNMMPDGKEYFEAVKSLGSLKGAVLKLAKETNPFFTPVWNITNEIWIYKEGVG